LSVGIGVWVATLLAAPAWLFPLGSFICHQRPERSFFIEGSQIAVCARCTGLYVGAALAAPWGLIAASSLTSARARRVLIAASVPTALTWSLEFAGLAAFSNVARFIAALPLGFAAAWLVVSVIGDA
jgi:uncharacterized membrane protein